jgi:RNA polymerase sigma-70 factor, ECF subfamily
MTDEEIIERVRRGETRHFGELVRRYQDDVYGMAVRFVGSAADAEDIAQEVFLRVHRGLDGFKGEARFSTWLFRVTYNLSADWLRKHRKPGRLNADLEEADEVADTRADIEEGLLVAEERDQVRRAVEDLDENYRVVIVLLYYQKLSYDQIAEVLAVPLKTVETRLYRARKLLRARLERASSEGVRA